MIGWNDLHSFRQLDIGEKMIPHGWPDDGNSVLSSLISSQPFGRQLARCRQLLLPFGFLPLDGSGIASQSPTERTRLTERLACLRRIFDLTHRMNPFLQQWSQSYSVMRSPPCHTP